MRGPPQIFDRRLYALRRARAGDNEFLATDVALQLAERIATMNRRFERGLDLVSRPQAFATLRSCAKDWTRTRLAPGDAGVVADEELLPFAIRSFDLITSVLSLHAANDLPGALVQIRRTLKPNGLFVGALFGGETLGELRNSLASAESELRGGASPRVAPFADVRDLGALLQRAGFLKSVADVERTIVHYRSFKTLVEDLRGLGESNALTQRTRHFLRRDVLSAAVENYRQNHADEDGRLRATYDIVYLTGCAPGV